MRSCRRALQAYTRKRQKDQDQQVAVRHAHLNVGITIPRRITRWDSKNTTNVGIVAMTSDAMTIGIEWFC